MFFKFVLATIFARNDSFRDIGQKPKYCISISTKKIMRVVFVFQILGPMISTSWKTGIVEDSGIDNSVVNSYHMLQVWEPRGINPVNPNCLTNIQNLKARHCYWLFKFEGRKWKIEILKLKNKWQSKFGRKEWPAFPQFLLKASEGR